MCTMLTRETQIWTEWETCVTTALWNIILIRCVDTLPIPISFHLTHQQ